MVFWQDLWLFHSLDVSTKPAYARADTRTHSDKTCEVICGRKKSNSQCQSIVWFIKSLKLDLIGLINWFCFYYLLWCDRSPAWAPCWPSTSCGSDFSYVFHLFFAQLQMFIFIFLHFACGMSFYLSSYIVEILWLCNIVLQLLAPPRVLFLFLVQVFWSYFFACCICIPFSSYNYFIGVIVTCQSCSRASYFGTSAVTLKAFFGNWFLQ